MRSWRALGPTTSSKSEWLSLRTACIYLARCASRPYPTTVRLLSTSEHSLEARMTWRHSTASVSTGCFSRRRGGVLTGFVPCLDTEDREAPDGGHTFRAIFTEADPLEWFDT